MNNYLYLTKFLFKYNFKKSGQNVKSKNILLIILSVIGTLILVGFFSLMIYSITMVFNELGLFIEFLSIILLITSIVVAFFGLIPMLNSLYFCKDVEFLNHLPIKNSTIYFAKLTVVYINELFLTILFMLPSIFVIGISLHLNFAYYVVMVIALLFTPSVPCLIMSILAIPLMYIVRLFKNKGVAQSIAIILLFALFFTAYYFLIYKSMTSLNEHSDANIVVEMMRDKIQIMSNIAFPFLAVARCAMLSNCTIFGTFNFIISFIINALTFIVSIAILVSISILISRYFYKKGSSAILENRKSSSSIKKVKSENRKTPFKALLNKEWRELIRTPAAAYQCLAGYIGLPIIMLFFSFGMNIKTGTALQGDDLIILASMTFFALMYFVTIFGIGTNAGASSTISRERENIYHVKTMPVSYKVQINAKLSLYMIITSLVTIIGIIIDIVISFRHLGIIRDSIGQTIAFYSMFIIGSFAFLLIYNYAFNCLYIYTDLKNPKLNWVNINEVIKNNKNLTIPFFINMLVGLLFSAIPILLVILLSNSLLLALLIGWTVLVIIALILAVIFHKLLYSNIDRLFNKIG